MSAAAAGCSSTGTVTRPVSPSLVADEQALALPPPGGPAVIGVVERNRANGVEQTISLATTSRIKGQNFLRIEYFGPAVSQGEAASFRTVNERQMLREAASAVPGVRLTRRSTFLQNSYGPFAYAAGRSPLGDTCIYAWQQIRAGATSGGIGRNFGMIQVRWRLCDSFAGEQQLLSAVYGYTITGTFEGAVWNPFGEPPGADTRLGKTGQPIYPVAGAPAGALPMGYAGGIDLTPVASTARRTVPPRASSRPVPSVQPAARVEPARADLRVPSPQSVSTGPAAEGSATAPKQPKATAPTVRVPSPENF